jgi:hypothetical protein
MQLPRDFRQGFLAYQACPQQGHGVFVGRGTLLEQSLCHDIAEHRIAEKFQSFVVNPGKTLVRQCLKQQVRAIEAIPQRGLQRGDGS